MRFPRAAGILLHPTSLPGPNGIGEIGPEAVAWVDWLASAGMKIWQVLPLGPTGYADSPYQLFSAFAGNPLLLSLQYLLDREYLDPKELMSRPPFPSERVDYGWVIHWKYPVLARAAERFFRSKRDDAPFRRFCERNAQWLDDYARFMAAKQPEYGVDVHRYWQFEFSRQWCALKDHCAKRGIRVMGDLPIYVAGDSADVQSHPELFRHDFVAGVPPDYFSATGQLWGNPIYDWAKLKETGYAWWIERIRATLTQVDLIRLDHFRGFEAYWQVPAGEKTAVNGEWVQGPGADFFRVAEAKLGQLPIVAENLGVITPEVESIRHEFGYPGMSVLQFAFGNDPQAPTFRPHNYPREVVAYTGTHDNDTTIGWWDSEAGGTSTRSEEDIRKEREFTKTYLRTDGNEINWVFIQTIMASVADTVLAPLQDVLGLGGEARMNLPGRPDCNWQWRFRREMLMPEYATRLAAMAEAYDR